MAFSDGGTEAGSGNSEISMLTGEDARGWGAGAMLDMATVSAWLPKGFAGSLAFFSVPGRSQALFEGEGGCFLVMAAAPSAAPAPKPPEFMLDTGGRMGA